MNGEACLGDWIEKLRESLSLIGNGANNVDLSKCRATEQLWKSNRTPLFTNLSSIYIYNFPRLRNLGQLSAAGKDCLPQLKKLQVGYCEMMKQVLLWNANGTESVNHPSITKIFPKLTEVVLCRLPNLVTFYQGIEHIQFPLLSEMYLKQCPKMISMGSNEFPRLTRLAIENCPKMMWGGNSRSADIGDDCSHLLCQVSFGNLEDLEIDRNPFCRHEIPSSLFNRLEELEITEYQGYMSLFTSSLAGNLVNLKKLYIVNCGEMLKVIEDEEEQVVSGGERTTALIFPKLEYLYLRNLPKLVSFCEWKCDIKLLSLTYVNIQNCCAMRNFTLGSLSTPNLGILKIDEKAIGATEDLNIALQQHLARAKAEEKEEEEGGEENQETMGEIDSSSKI